MIIGSFSFRNSRRFLGCVSARRRSRTRPRARRGVFQKREYLALVVNIDRTGHKLAVMTERAAEITAGHEQCARRMLGIVQQRELLQSAYFYKHRRASVFSAVRIILYFRTANLSNVRFDDNAAAYLSQYPRRVVAYRDRYSFSAICRINSVASISPESISNSLSLYSSTV